MSFFEWVLNLPAAKHTRLKYHQPRTIVTYVRTLLAQMKDKHDWNYSFDKDFKFEGVEWCHN